MRGRTPEQDKEPITGRRPSVGGEVTRTLATRVVFLQRSAGNQAVSALMARRTRDLNWQAVPTVQRRVERDKFNLVGEDHAESDAVEGDRRKNEEAMADELELTYYTESTFKYAPLAGGLREGDNPKLRALQVIGEVASGLCC